MLMWAKHDAAGDEVSGSACSDSNNDEVRAINQLERPPKGGCCAANSPDRGRLRTD